MKGVGEESPEGETVQAVADLGEDGRPFWAADTGLMSLVLMVRFHGLPADPAPVAHTFSDRNNPLKALDLLRNPVTGRRRRGEARPNHNVRIDR